MQVRTNTPRLTWTCREISLFLVHECVEPGAVSLTQIKYKKRRMQTTMLCIFIAIIYTTIMRQIKFCRKIPIKVESYSQNGD